MDSAAGTSKSEEKVIENETKPVVAVEATSAAPASDNLNNKNEDANNENTIILLNSSSESEILDEKNETDTKSVQNSSDTNKDAAANDDGNDVEQSEHKTTDKETTSEAADDDGIVAMDIDEELTGKVVIEKDNKNVNDEPSSLKSNQDDIQEENPPNLEDTNKATEEILNESDLPIEDETELITPIAVSPVDEDEMDAEEPGEQDNVEMECDDQECIIELFDDEEIEINPENNEITAVQPTEEDKIDIDKSESEVAASNTIDDTKNVETKNEIKNDNDVEDGGITEESDKSNTATKPILDINKGIKDIMTEKIKKVMHEEDSVFYGKECVNYECNQKCKYFYKAPLFILNFYKIPRKINKTQYVCDDCYNKSVSKYEELSGALVDHQALLYQDIPKRQDFVEILDSSDEDETGKTMENGNGDFQKDTIDFLQKELDVTLSEVLQRVDINKQLNWTKDILQDKLKKIEEENEIITNSLKSLQRSADHMHTSLYQCPKIKIKQLDPFDLNTNKTYKSETEFTIPPIGELTFPPIEVNGDYFAVKNKAIASWLPCKVVDKMDVSITGQKSLKYYKIRFHKMKIPSVKCVSAKHMAYGDPPRVRLSIGIRIIALFDGSTLSRKGEKIPNFKSAFYPGIIAEPLQSYNGYRYLVFFDDGYAQYVYHKDIRVVCYAAENVWEDVHQASREFIHNYLTQYQKNRPMVQVKKGQTMITESNGKWLYAKVVDIDASLVQMQFEGQNRTEWIYRGSTRLGPLFREKQTKRTMQVTQIHRQRSEPYVRYYQNEDIGGIDSYDANTAERQSRAVAKKSISRADFQQPVKHLNNSVIFLEDDNKPKGKVVYYTAKKNVPPKRFVPHECTPKCLFPMSHGLKHYSPLAKPLLSGWERQIVKNKLKKIIVYRTPCGRCIRNMEELHRYLRKTQNILNVDNFDFDALTHCLAEYVIERSIVQKDDLSEGAENMIIPCINYYDNTMPPKCTYSTKRIPTQGVNLNLDPEFLVGCDCKDDCADKTKCSCWQLTLAGAKFGNPNTPIENIGYQYKRLPEAVNTGIYECNVRCKCSSKCLNRVAQHPLQMKLQVFKTSNRGWGLRCINDVPKGSFICIYAGHLLTEQNANEGGANSGDEYFAELDYIEVVERLKEGYESDVQEEVEESEEEFEELNQENDSDEDFKSSASINKTAPLVNTRLRARCTTKDFSDTKDDEKLSKKSNEDDDDGERQVINFEANTSLLDNAESTSTKYKSIRKYYGKNEFCYVMDAKKTGNIGRYFNHSCAPNLFVQNVFVDTHDLRFPWVAFFALSHIRAGTELTWNYNYEVGIVPGKVLYCECGAPNCRGRLL